MRALVDHLRAGDVLVVNDAFTIPAAFTAEVDGTVFELRLIETPDEEGRARAITLGAGPRRDRTEDRPPPPVLVAGASVLLGHTLHARVLQVLGHPRLVQLSFSERGARLWSRLLRAGRPIQYAYVEEPLALFDVQTAYAGIPFAAELPSAGYGLTWGVLGALRAKGVRLATVTHAAGISSTGDATLDAQLPLQERSVVGAEAVRVIAAARAAGGRVIAVGTSVVRALESAAAADGSVQAGVRDTTLRLDRSYRLRVVSGLLTGMHAPGESHYELLEAFVPAPALRALAHTAASRGLLSHEFGDALLLIPALLPLPVPESPQRR